MATPQQILDWQDVSEVNTKRLKAGFTRSQVTDLYNQWAKEGYDKTFTECFGLPQRLMVEALKEVFPRNRDEVVILDVGCGSGITGQHLHETGFTLLDALDPAEEMLRVAERKRVYRNLFHFGVTAEPTSLPADSYDAVVTVASMGHGQLECAAFEELSRIVKPGGYIFNCLRKAFLQEVPDYIQHWQPMIDRMQREGRWEVLKLETYENHFIGKDGLLTVFKVLK